MKTWPIRLARGAMHATLLLAVLATSTPAAAGNWGARREYREGMREIARERREMRREILSSGSRAEARREYREGMREIARERREMRREVHRELRYARGAAPAPPAPGLCWHWSDVYQQNGYWDRCGAY
jgi:hypothetical protein